MKKLLFSLLFFSAIAWLWIGHIIAADGSLNNISGTTTLGGSPLTGTGLTNGNVNAFVIFTNNQVSISYNSSGIFTITNYAAANRGFSFGTNGTLTIGGAQGIGIVAGDNGEFGSALSGGSGAKVRVVTVNGATDNNVSLVRSDGSFGFIFSMGGGSSQNYRMLGNGNQIVMNGVGGGAYSQWFNATTNNGGTLAMGANIIVTNGMVWPTNYVAANFTPEPGCVKVVSSNGILWKVSQLSTQLLDAAQSP